MKAQKGFWNRLSAKMDKRITGILSTLLLFIGLNGCSKDDSAPSQLLPEQIETPALASISPTSGPKTTVVNLKGSNFGTDAGAIQVFFNDKEAVVQSVSDDQITTVVPARAFSGLVKVAINGKEIFGPTFTYIITEIEVGTLAGGSIGFSDGTGDHAQFKYPSGLATDADGNLYVADRDNHKIRKLTSTGIVTTIAGSSIGFLDGPGASAQFKSPTDVAVDAEGKNIYVADWWNHKIRKIVADGTVSTVGGSTQGFMDGLGANAQFNFPSGVVLDTMGNVYVADQENSKIRKVTIDGSVGTFSGSVPGNADGVLLSAQFEYPSAVAIDNNGVMYVADEYNHSIRKITPAGVVSTFAGSDEGFADGPATSAKFKRPTGLAVDAAGNVYVADHLNHKIRMITPEGMVSTLAGTTQGFMDGVGSSAQFDRPFGVAVDAYRNVYVSDLYNHKIRRITQE